MTDGSAPRPPAPGGPRRALRPGTARAAQDLPPRFGVVLAVVLGIGLFTGIGTGSRDSSGEPYDGRTGPRLLGPQHRSAGPQRQVSLPAGGNVQPHRGPVLRELVRQLPPGAATAGGGRAPTGRGAWGTVTGPRPRSRRPRFGRRNAKSFIKSSGVTFPVAYDPNVSITGARSTSDGDPYTVFVGRRDDRQDRAAARCSRRRRSPPTSRRSFPAERERRRHRSGDGPDREHGPRLRRAAHATGRAWRGARREAPRRAAAWRSGQARSAASRSGRSCRPGAGATGRGRWPRRGSTSARSVPP